MATHFVKWWKTKFMNGYRHMAVILPSELELRPSDTEELLNHEDTASVNGSVVNSEIPLTGLSVTFSSEAIAKNADEKSNLNHCNRKKELKFEEFECDVSVGTQENGDRQEFSFTLYDLEGRGKITKDDVAGLVKTIYDAVGSSVKLAPSGSKTIRVKLTVSPEKSEEANEGGKIETSKEPPPPGSGSFRWSVKNPTDIPLPPKVCCPRKKDVNILSENHLREKIYAEAEKLFIEKESNVRNPKVCRQMAEGPSPMLPRKCRTVQDSPLRKCHNEVCDHGEADPLLPNHGCCGGHCRARRRFADCSYRHRRLDEEQGYLNNGEERRYYAHIFEADENDTCRLKGDCQTRFEPLKRHAKNSYHRRSRSHDLNNVYAYAEEEEFSKPPKPSYYSRLERPSHNRSRSCENYEILSPKLHRHRVRTVLRPECLSETASPHHLLRHKHRERDQARAMQQVARWLARQKISDPEAGTEADVDEDDWETVDGGKYRSFFKNDFDPEFKLNGSFKLYEDNGLFKRRESFRFEEKRTKKTKSRQRSTTVPASVLNGYRVRKHEHKHVHEHIHHHYHHYNMQQQVVL